MVLRAKAGTPLAVVAAALDAHGQMLPFEPIDHRALYGGGEPTIGGLVAANASGPRRVSAGAARDSVIGLRLVNGRGEAIMTGGRVMKNVAGLDLVKLNCGALGILGFLTEATFKLLPKPESEATIVIRRLDERGRGRGDDGRARLAVSASAARRGCRPAWDASSRAPSCASRASPPRSTIAPTSCSALLPNRGRARAEGRGFASAVARVARRRVSRRAARARGLAGRRQAVARRRIPRPARVRARCAHLFDCGGGLVWLATEPTPADAAAVRAALAPFGGHATLARAPDALRAAVDVFAPPPPALVALTRRVKAAFDPDGLFNRGRMYAGI